MIPFRVMCTALGAIASLFIAPWITAVCIVVLSVRFRALEAVALGSLLDFLWLPHDSVLTMFPLCTIVSLVLVWGFEPLRLEFLH